MRVYKGMKYEKPCEAPFLPCFPFPYKLIQILYLSFSQLSLRDLSHLTNIVK